MLRNVEQYRISDRTTGHIGAARTRRDAQVRIIFLVATDKFNYGFQVFDIFRIPDDIRFKLE